MAPPLDESKLSPLGVRLLAWIRSQGWENFHEAAKVCDVPYRQLLDIAWGRNDPRVSTLQSIVERLGATMGEFYADPER